ncbi:MAG: CPXCG motif-containing cysteine-rich protein [Candidatus Eremiobacteraeota bacterium]|nr:CPXCG motif-containing cysteine-rich protein [Candidatus Eremiobacteraeota bacterium]
MTTEHFFLCPHCWQRISMVLDLGQSQSYVEDCEVCCNPLAISYQAYEGELEDFSVEPAQ